MEVLNLKCKTCGINYEKPSSFEKWNKEYPNVFYRWSLTFCDSCRKIKEKEALKSLPEVIKALMK